MNEILLTDLEKTHKLCARCDCYKLRSRFHKQSKKRNDLQSYCKDCNRECVKNTYSKNIKDPTFRIKLKERLRKSITPPGKSISYTNKYLSKYPERHKARQKVSNEIRAGRIYKQPCEVCGSLTVEAHHDDYSKPLDIRWLCRTHHKEHHRKYK